MTRHCPTVANSDTSIFSTPHLPHWSSRVACLLRHPLVYVLPLDTIYDKVTPGSFVVIVRQNPNNPLLDNPLVARVEAVDLVTRTDYNMPATKVTQLTLDRPWLTANDTSLAHIRNVTVYLQSESLPLDGEPYDADVGPDRRGRSQRGRDRTRHGLRRAPADRLLIVAGGFLDVPGTTGVKAAEVTVVAASTQVIDAGNTAGQGYPHTVLLQPHRPARAFVSARKRDGVRQRGPQPRRARRATKFSGAGKAGQANQRFALKQSPLTYLAAATPTGAEPEIEVRINGVLWKGAGASATSARTTGDTCCKRTISGPPRSRSATVSTRCAASHGDR